jgi:hypothetical protein
MPNIRGQLWTSLGQKLTLKYGDSTGNIVESVEAEGYYKQKFPEEGNTHRGKTPSTGETTAILEAFNSGFRGMSGGIYKPSGGMPAPDMPRNPLLNTSKIAVVSPVEGVYPL